MRPHTQQQQQHHQQQYCGIDNNLPPQQQQQQHSHKNNHLNYQGLQQHQSPAHLQQQQQNYHQQQQQQHQLQQHLNHGPLPAAANPHHMWNTHANPNCYPSQSLNAGNAGNSSQLANSNNGHINLQNCRPYPPRVYGHPSTHPAHHATNGFAHAAPPPNHVNERVPLTAPNYAKLPPLSVVNQQRINECAGIPLISTASAHLTPGQRQRISRKQSHSPPGRNWPNVLANNAATAQNYAAAAQYAAAHAQGAPLMLNKQQQKPEYWSPNSYALQQQQQQQYANKSMQFSKPQDRTRTPLRYQNSAPAALNSSRSKENLEQHLKHVNKDTENSSSNNGDSSNSNETCLPRIIKPRKRRKKDRKPPNMINAVYMKMDNKPSQDKINTGGGGSSSIKPYKSSEDLMKCLQKFTQINNFKEDPSTKRTNEVSLLIENISQEFPQTGGCTSGRMDINHGICFCAECDPLRSIWDYPLRRSISDSSSSSTSGTGSLSEDSKQNDSISPKTRAEIVGVIGSKRNKDHLQVNSNSTFSTQYENLENSPDNQCLYNMNILSGINLANEIFKHNNSTLDPFTNLTNPLSSLLPETAETLLTKSINEISKKLIETCSNETTDLPLSSNNSTFSTTSCSSSSTSSSANSTCNDFSNDSGIESAHINAGDDLVFNFDHLHITATKLSLSQQQQQQSQSLSTSSCGNISTSTSPTVKFASNFLTTQTTCTKATPPASTLPTTTHPHHHIHQNPTTPSKPIKTQAAPTLEFLVDLNNNQLHAATTTATTLTKDMNVIQNNQQQQQQHQQQHQLQQFNDLLQNHQPPQHQQHQQLQTPHRHDQQFFNNCFDLMWQQHERQLGNNNNTSNNNDQLISSSSNTASNNVAMSSFLDAVGSVKTVFSTIS